MPRPAFARRRSDVYVGMLALSALATALGCAMLALELGDYEWVTSPTGARLNAPVIPEAAPTAPGAPAGN